jgi:hypothetical protein
MRLLGYKTNLATFRWDLTYLIAQLISDDRPGISDLAPPVQAILKQIDDERAAYEQVEDAMIVAGALLDKRDQRRDKVLIAAGGALGPRMQRCTRRSFPGTTRARRRAWASMPSRPTSSGS